MAKLPYEKTLKHRRWVCARDDGHRVYVRADSERMAQGMAAMLRGGEMSKWTAEEVAG